MLQEGCLRRPEGHKYGRSLHQAQSYIRLTWFMMSLALLCDALSPFNSCLPRQDLLLSSDLLDMLVCYNDACL